ncbi:hypothetical protein CJ030_MR8G002360 [Morella rubra]|uniref:Uncharacterized protein n=1 Tax=Morella rubra TaxID=262757 RepID=A0A6A1UQ05_9ROSI|nr:hypothetical protein CJ030_MR8G002360 [Morella rubra]
MDKVHEELDEAKAKIEKLRAEYQSKAELCEILKKAHNEQLIKWQEASLKIEKQSQELNGKAEEISETKQICDELKGILSEKESIIKHLSAANERLRVDCEEKSIKWEKANRDLVLALDDANEKIMVQEQNICAYREEIEGLKGCLSVSQNKCLEAEKRSKASKELQERDDMMLNLDEEKRKLEDQLKWKKEQFTHLKEAHEKLRDQFKASKKEWEQERSTLHDEVCSLQTSLDSQTRISEDLKNRLQMCNQALAHEESRRKYLQAQVSEFQTRFENTFVECQESKSLLECLTAQRDKEISALRHSLGTKESMFKEMKYQAGKLEQENQELRISLRELQEAGIQESGDLNDCQCELENKDIAIKGLRMELEGCESLAMQLKLQNEDLSVMLLVLKLGISEAQLKLTNEKAAMDAHAKQRDENFSLVMKQLEVKNAALSEAQSKLARENAELDAHAKQREENVSLQVKKVEVKNAALSEAQLKLAKEKAVLDEHAKQRKEDVSLLVKQLEARNAALLEAQSMLAKEKAELDAHGKQREEHVSLLVKQLGVKNAALLDTQSKLAKEKAELDAHAKQRAEDVSLLVKQLEAGNAALLEAQSKLAKEKVELDAHGKQRDENVSSLVKQLEVKNAALLEAQSKLAKEKAELNAHAKQKEEDFSLLVKQLEVRNADLSEAQSKLAKEKAELDVLVKQREENVSLLMKELEVKSAALGKAQRDIVEERKKTESLSRRIECLEIIDQQQTLMQTELERYKDMLEESSRCQFLLEEKILQTESSSQEKFIEVCDALERANAEYEEKFSETNEIEFELQMWISIAERLKVDLEENHMVRKELEASLLSEVDVELTIKQEKNGLMEMLKQRERRIEDLQEQIVTLEQERKTRETEATSLARRETPLSSDSEEASFFQKMREKDKILEQLETEVVWLEQESLRREFESAVLSQIVAERTSEHEKEKLIHILEDSNKRIDYLRQLVKSLEQKFNSSMISFSSQLAEKQAVIYLVHEAWESIAAAEILAVLEVEEKKLMITELEDDIHNIQQKLELQEKSLCYSRLQAVEIESQLEARQSEMENLTIQMETKLRTSDALVDELKSEKRSLLEDVTKLLSDRENLLGFIAGLDEGISELTAADSKLMAVLSSMVQSFDNNGSGIVLEDDDVLFHSVKENLNIHPSPATKKCEAISDARPPFRERNL